ncbi:hypothetical protein KEM55_004903 [Ascosphaera atra]|nr:hypothetical protein KEM55_004903 [Ascosphaera atra]
MLATATTTAASSSPSQVAQVESAFASSLRISEQIPPRAAKRRKILHNNNDVTDGSSRTATPDVLDDDIGGVFSIRPRADSKETGSVSLKPIALVPRARLPLSWLDPCVNSSRRIGSGRLFLSDIPVLEKLSTSHTPRNEPLALAARVVSSSKRSSGSGIRRSYSMSASASVAGPTSGVSSLGDGLLERDELYVLERVTKGIYAVCALGSWVEVQDVYVAAATSATTAIGGNPALKRARTSWSRKPSPGPVKAESSSTLVSRKGTPEDDEAHARAHLAANELPFPVKEEVGAKPHTPIQADISQVSASGADLQPSAPVGGAEMPAMAPPPAPELAAPVPDAAVDTDTFMSVDAPTSQPPEEILENLRIQYLEALYMSKSSVAYFAKGPLSRARALFVNSQQGLSASTLATSYRERIIQLKRMDLKYRETLPETIKKVALTTLSGEETANGGTKKPRKKKTKNSGKIGRNGFYPDEEEFALRWWKDRDFVSATAGPDQAAREQEMKRLISELRLRETQLQILLILEAMSIEALAKQGQRLQPEAATEDDMKGKKKQKKPQDLNVLLDLLMDRLCIWCTVSFGDILPPDPTQPGTSTEKSKPRGEEEKVRDFATEVIIPFYLSRLPEQCKMITRKLGISTSTTPPRKSTAHHSSSAKSKNVTPGTAVKRTRPQKVQRTSLHRVLTDEKLALASRPRTARPFSRSQSELHDLRRRSQIDPLSATTPPAASMSRPPVADKREVDLQAVSKQHEAKIKKMSQLVDQKKELDAAIDALRKPNREQLVARNAAEEQQRVTLVQASEKVGAAIGASTGSGSSRKSKIPVRNPFGQGVQVMMTPKRPGRKKLFEDSARAATRRSSLSFLKSQEKEPSSSLVNESPSVIPASASRTRPYHPSLMSKTSDVFSKPTHVAENFAIQATPTKPRHFLPLNSNSQPPSSIPTNGIEPATPPSKSNLFPVPQVPDSVTKTLTTSVQKEEYHVPATPSTSRQILETKQSGSMPPPPLTVTPVKRVTETSVAATSAADQPLRHAQAQSQAVATSVKAPSTPQQVVTSVAAVSGEVAEGKESTGENIYNKLGWDDDGLGSDDELAW